MRYVAVLECPVTGLAESAQCFNSDLCRVTQVNGDWVLESSEFNACLGPTEVFPLADAALSVVRRIMSLYCGLSYPFTVSYIQCLGTDGQACGRTYRSSLTLTITSSTATAELATPIHGQPLATAIFECAQKGDEIREALKLFQDTENRWTDIYNMIEFLGGPKQIRQLGFGTETEAALVMRTANHYRHLGCPEKYPLPFNPPTLEEGSLFAKRAVRLWIESRL
jgi:hypothetical protein